MPEDALVVNGTRVDPILFEVRQVRRCALGECDSLCCVRGVSVFSAEIADIREHAETIKPHMAPERREVDWFDGVVVPEEDHPDGGTAEGVIVMDDPTHPAGRSCVFLRSDLRCALQVAGPAAGEHAWRFKPFWCSMHPLVYDGGVLTLAADSPVFAAGGSCARPDPGSGLPLYRVYEQEVRLALGDAGYEELDAIAKRRAGAADS